VLEGGSVDVDGEGTCLTTESCLLDGVRNPALDRGSIERVVGEALGVRKFVWLERGLENDHTDGHNDTLARFVAPGEVVCMEPAGKLDPNAEVLREVEATLRDATDASGTRLTVRTIRSPGEVRTAGGSLLAASYCNFYIANEAVIVPTYGVRNDDAAIQSVRAAFRDRRVIGLPARAIVYGGGAFHCMTQQQPRFS
jgi:agmatine deiminase